MKYRLFGESHASEIGVEIEGLPKGTEIDLRALRAFLARRAPGHGQGGLSTTRREADEPLFERGLAPAGDGSERAFATGETVRAVIRNTNVRPNDYANVQTVPRPGHADYASWLKYGTIPTGGGKWSGRLTAPLCIAGGIALQMLARSGVSVAARIVEIGGRPYDAGAPRPDLGGDSLGGIVEVVATGVPAGLGDAGTDGLESILGAALFGIPAVKGVEFGDGFALAKRRGSEANDPFVIRNGKVTLASNHCGGLLGGVSIGLPIVARAAFKPTPSISLEQRSVDLAAMREVPLTVKGRHDACVVFRAVPVVEAAVALALADEMQKAGKTGGPPCP